MLSIAVLFNLVRKTLPRVPGLLLYIQLKSCYVKKSTLGIIVCKQITFHTGSRQYILFSQSLGEALTTMPGKLKNMFEQNLEEEEPPPIIPRRPKPGVKKSFLQKTGDGDPSPVKSPKTEVLPSPKRLPVLEIPNLDTEVKEEIVAPDQVQLVTQTGSPSSGVEESLLRKAPEPEKQNPPTRNETPKTKELPGRKEVPEMNKLPENDVIPGGDVIQPPQQQQQQEESRPPTPSDIDENEKELPMPVADVSMMASPVPFMSSAAPIATPTPASPHQQIGGSGFSYPRAPTPPPQKIVLEIRLPEPAPASAPTTAPITTKQIVRSESNSTAMRIEESDIAASPQFVSKTPSVAPWEGPSSTTVPHSDPRRELSSTPINNYEQHVPFILPSINDISATMEALQKSMSPQQHDSVRSSVGTPTPTQSSLPQRRSSISAAVPPVYPEELKKTLDEIMNSLGTINSDVLTSLQGIGLQTNTRESELAVPQPTSSSIPGPEYISQQHTASIESNKEIKREIDRLRSKQQQAERKNELDCLSQEIYNLKQQQKEQEKVRTSLLDLQLLQQSIMSEQFQKQMGASHRQKAIDKQQRHYLAKYLEYQKELNKTIKKSGVSQPQVQQEERFSPAVDINEEIAKHLRAVGAGGGHRLIDDGSTDSQLSQPQSKKKSSDNQSVPAVLTTKRNYQQQYPSSSIGESPRIASHSKPIASNQVDPEVREWLVHLRLERYISIFTVHQITLESFVRLTDTDIVEMGITALGPRKVLQRFIEEYQKSKSPGRVVVPSTTPGKLVQPMRVSKSIEKSVERDRVNRERERERTRHPTIEELEAKLVEAQTSITRQQRLREQIQSPLQRQQQQSQPDEWSVYVDPNTSRLYYANNRTQETQWEPPPDMRTVRTDNLNDVL